MRFLLRFFLLLTLLFGSLTSSYALDWNKATQGDFIRAMARAANGDFWVGTEDFGVWRRGIDKQWTQFKATDGLGDDTVTALAFDAQGRLWAGTVRGGVSVWNGQSWKAYGVLEGAPGAGITDISVSRAADQVWIAGEDGLVRYSDAAGWVSFDEPLTRHPMVAVAASDDGKVVLAGTSCEGLLISHDGGSSWEKVLAGAAPTVTATGAGLPSNLVNDVAIDSMGTFWAATVDGVAKSADGGKSWFYLRGADWKANVEGLASGVKPKETRVDTDLLAQDWVTQVTPTADGKIWLGFREKGAELRDAETFEAIFATRDDPRLGATIGEGDYVSTLFPLRGDVAILGRCGGGVAGMLNADFPAPPANAAPAAALPPNPAPLAPLSAAALSEAATKLAAQPGLTAGQGAFWGLDRLTRGDWPGRYGNTLAELYGIDEAGPMEHEGFDVGLGTGRHRVDPNFSDFYSYTHWDKSENPNVVWVPKLGLRRQAELNDGTWNHNKYPFSWQGPDLWARVEVPAGAYRVSLYWFNKDGHGGLNRYRDHPVNLRAWTADKDDEDEAPILARTRLMDAWNGVYASFLVVGPSKFRIQTERNHSHATDLQGIFIDDLKDTAPKTSWAPLSYGAPAVPATGPNESATLKAARALWAACDEAEARGVVVRQQRIQALRAATAEAAPADLLKNWRWRLAFWSDAERDEFNTVVVKQP